MAEAGFACPLCGGTTAGPELTLHDRVARTSERAFNLVRCAGCGLLRLHPQPDAATIAAAYTETYAPHRRPGLSGRAKGWLEQRSARRLWRYLAPPRRVLDIGCATGDLLAAVQAFGNPRVHGIEPGERAAATARARGIEILGATLEDAALEARSVDTVILSHTLEHVADPIATLREVARVLTPGGALLLWLPNADSIEARVFGRYWIGYDAPRHLTTFGVQSLTRALTATGFEVILVTHEWIGLEWAWALRLWLRERVPRIELLFSRLHPLVIVAATPLAAVGALTHRSGRVHVVAALTATQMVEFRLSSSEGGSGVVSPP